ncbi:alpha/beta hydrolase [Enterococcus sp. AZ192]|uniref:alpha/beta hydrolase n=1 Tax=unclassified Enterococcus TaxID=2608891 RepID=UPI003D2718F0
MKKWQKRLLWIAGVIVALLLIGLFYLKTITYTPTTSAIESAEKAKNENGTLVFRGDPEKPSVIFYQGALVENTSYSLWAEQVAEAGYSVYLVKQPLNLAVLGQNKAEAVIQKNQLSNYVIGGHSLGGVMASRFAADQEKQAAPKGVFFLASYPDEKGSLAKFTGPVLSLTGSEDGVLNWTAYDESKRYLPKQTLYEKISGGNHAGFGSYGEQKGDHPASIDNEEQQHEIAEHLINWLKNIK